MKKIKEFFIRLHYALFGYMSVEVECPHGKFWPGTYKAGQNSTWGCGVCPMKLKIKWH